MSPPGIWVLQPIHEHHSTDLFPSVAGHCEWLCAPLCGCQLVGTDDKTKMGVTWLLSNGEIFPGVSNHTGTMFSQAMAWGDAKKPWWAMAFLLITPSIAAWYKRIFGFIAVWVHPHQAHYTTPADVAQKLVLLMDGSANWVYAFVQLNEVLSHAPLSSVGHISTMTAGQLCSPTHCSQLHQLQVNKLLQCQDLVVCPEGFNSQMEASQFTFKELSLWNATAPSKPASKMQLMAVDLGSAQPGDVTAIAPASASQQGMLKEHPPSAALEVLLAAKELEDPFGPEGTDTVTSAPMVIFTSTIPFMMQMSLQVPIPTGALSSADITPQPLQPALPKTSQMWSLPFLTQPQAPIQG